MEYKRTSSAIDLMDIQRFIDDCGASIDCWHAVFDYLKRAIPLQRKNWHAIPELRNFLEENLDKNPYIPKRYFERHLLSKKGGDSFIGQWKKRFPIENLSINTEHYVKTLKQSNMLNKRSKTLPNTHSVSTYFCKCLEWYLSYIHCGQNKVNCVVDVGSSTSGAAIFFNEVLSLERIYLVDLAYQGPNSNITMVGTDAKNLSYFADDSIDFICMHNAIEHFAGDSDSGAIKECSRILKPGGKVHISPFNFSSQYTILVNPISLFYLRPDEYLHAELEKELNSGCGFRFNNKMASQFARLYDWNQFEKRVIPFLNGLLPKLRPVGFDLEGGEYGLVNGLMLKLDVFKRRNFHLLELTKR